MSTAPVAFPPLTPAFSRTTRVVTSPFVRQCGQTSSVFSPRGGFGGFGSRCGLDAGGLPGGQFPTWMGSLVMAATVQPDATTEQGGESPSVRALPVVLSKDRPGEG